MIKTFTLFLSAIAIFGGVSSLRAQCSGSTGGSTAGTVTNDGLIGAISWNSPLAAVGSDNSRTSATALVLGQETNYLIATNFGFSLPASETICGITVEIERSATGFLQAVRDYSVRIVKNGVVTGTDHASSATWPSSDGTQTYGGSGDMWGTTWTPAEINSSGFGIAISADLGGVAVLPTARIDNIRITVHYVVPLPVSMLFFEALSSHEGAVLTWATATEINNRAFTVERSVDGISFEEIATIEGAGTSRTKKEYSYTDKRQVSKKVYYRLKQTDFDGTFSYSDIRSVITNLSEGLLLYPNPTVLNQPIYANIDGEESVFVSITDITGKEILSGKVLPDDKTGRFLIPGSQDLSVGSYFITIKGSKQVYQQRFIIKQF
jgi:hypothetical protein